MIRRFAKGTIRAAALLAAAAALSACVQGVAPMTCEETRTGVLDMSALSDAANAEFLKNYDAQPGVVKTASGLRYRVLASGKGAQPAATARVRAHYQGTLIDCTVFDSSYARNEPAVFPVNRLIPGWVEALQLMHEGDVWELVLPSNLAYGEQGAGADIPPRQTLIFKLELLQVM